MIPSSASANLLDGEPLRSAISQTLRERRFFSESLSGTLGLTRCVRNFVAFHPIKGLLVRLREES